MASDSGSGVPGGLSSARAGVAAAADLSAVPVEPGALASLSPAPDASAEPNGFTVEVAPAERIHFLDWGGPKPQPDGRPSVLLVHGLAGTAWGWAPVARRLCTVTRVVAADLRGHGLSDAPTTGYDRETLASDLVAVAEGAGLVGGPRERDAPGEIGASGASGAPGEIEASSGSAPRVVLAGHGFGGIVAAWAAVELGDLCAGLVLVDGGWQDIAAETGLTADEWLRDLAEPPEILRSMSAFLDDRRSWDPASWDADEERAARATVVEVPAGKVVPAIRPHALEHSVEAMFAYRPLEVLMRLAVPIVALMATDDGTRARALASLQAARHGAGRPAIRAVDLAGAGHNLPRYRPAEVAGAILFAMSAIVRTATNGPTEARGTK